VLKSFGFASHVLNNANADSIRCGALFQSYFVASYDLLNASSYCWVMATEDLRCISVLVSFGCRFNA
jgi:hypothetical protein